MDDSAASGDGCLWGAFRARLAVVGDRFAELGNARSPHPAASRGRGSGPAQKCPGAPVDPAAMERCSARRLRWTRSRPRIRRPARPNSCGTESLSLRARRATQGGRQRSPHGRRIAGYAWGDVHDSVARLARAHRGVLAIRHVPAIVEVARAHDRPGKGADSSPCGRAMCCRCGSERMLLLRSRTCSICCPTSTSSRRPPLGCSLMARRSPSGVLASQLESSEWARSSRRLRFASRGTESVTVRARWARRHRRASASEIDGADGWHGG